MFTKFKGFFFIAFLSVWATNNYAQHHHDAKQNHTEHEHDHSDHEHAHHGAEHSTAQHEEDKSKEFNLTEMVMHHISDSYDWHLFDWVDADGHEHPVSVPLPVILFDNGLHIFLSSEFDHGHKVVKKGDNYYALYHNHIYKTDEFGTINYDEDHNVTNATPLDFSLTRNAVSLILAALILLLIATSTALFYKKNGNTAPKGIAAIVEPLVMFIKDDVARVNIGEKKYMKFVPYLLTLFFFILINNLLGLIPIIPGGSNVTGNIAVTLTLAVFTMILVNINGTKDYWKHIFWMPGVPVPVKLLLAPIELVGIVSKPFALMVRLFANITAGHIIILSIISLIFIFKNIAIAPASIALGLFISLLELLVAFLQAYIFTILTALFVGMAVEEHDHHDHH